ncbi:nuclear control of ATPase protein 2 [Monosporozyma servazzii]
MLYDHFIAQKIDSVDGQLVRVLERVDWPVTPSTSKINILQPHLTAVKHLIDTLNSQIKDNSIHKVVKIDYTQIHKTIDELENFVPNSTLEQEIVTILNEYITIICYYTLINKLLIGLPQNYDDQSYFNNILSSNWNKLIYFIQTSLIKSTHLIKTISNFKSTEKTKKFHHLWKPQMMKLFMIQNIQLVGIPNDFKKLNPFKVIRFILWQQPCHTINNELSHIVATNSNELYEQTQKLGHLISLVDNESIDLTSLQNIFAINTKEIDISNDKIVKEITNFNQKQSIISYTKLGFLTRYWPIFCVSLIWGPRLIQTLWDSRFNLETFIQRNVIDLSKDLLHNWVWLPFKRILATIRHDESTMIAMVSKDTVQSEQDSLIRMIIKFLLDNGAIDTSSDIKQDDEIINSLIKQIELGQMDKFMTIYEQQLSQPIKNTMNGKLIRSILIQIQKMKVDGSIAMNGIDKMLKSQELLFGMIALSPSFLLLYSLGQMLHRLIRWGNIWSRGKTLKLKLNNSLNNMEKLLNYNYIKSGVDNEYYNLGLLAMETSNLYELGCQILPKKLRKQWKDDILELLNSNFTIDMKLNVISRIHHFYGKRF